VPKAAKQPYHLTPARLAAARASLRKANAVRLSRRYIYFMTPRRQAAAMGNLRKAHASPLARGNRFRHGLYCASLRATILRAGESLTEFEQHLKLFARAFRFPSFLRAREPRELIRAAGELFWRRLRAYRGFARHEAQQLRRALSQAPEGSLLSAGGALDLAHGLLEIFHEHITASKPLARVNRRAEDLLQAIMEKRWDEGTRFRILRWKRGMRSKLDDKPPGLLHNPLLSRRMLAGWQQHNRRGGQRRARRLATQLALEKHRGFDVADPASREECLRQFERVFASPCNADSFDRARRAAGLAWERLKCYHLHARQEVQLVRRLLQGAAARAPLPQDEMRDMAATLLRIFLHDVAAMAAAHEFEDRFRRELGALLEKRYGSRPEFEPFTAPPGSKTVWDTLHG